MYFFTIKKGPFNVWHQYIKNIWHDLNKLSDFWTHSPGITGGLAAAREHHFQQIPPSPLPLLTQQWQFSKIQHAKLPKMDWRYSKIAVGNSEDCKTVVSKQCLTESEKNDILGLISIMRRVSVLFWRQPHWWTDSRQRLLRCWRRAWAKLAVLGADFKVRGLSAVPSCCSGAYLKLVLMSVIVAIHQH